MFDKSATSGVTPDIALMIGRKGEKKEEAKAGGHQKKGEKKEEKQEQADDGKWVSGDDSLTLHDGSLRGRVNA